MSGSASEAGIGAELMQELTVVIGEVVVRQARDAHHALCAEAMDVIRQRVPVNTDLSRIRKALEDLQPDIARDVRQKTLARLLNNTLVRDA